MLDSNDPGHFFGDKFEAIGAVFANNMRTAIKWACMSLILLINLDGGRVRIPPSPPPFVNKFINIISESCK